MGNKPIKDLTNEQLIQEYITIRGWIDYVMSEPLGDWQEQLGEASNTIEPIDEELKVRGLERIAENTYLESCEMVESV